ncbi:MAG: aspartate ammonia-lyase, partial [Chloroflexota bacterium]|nr:aspartate ammonia-lyase [Chloroflexota bacterium]
MQDEAKMRVERDSLGEVTLPSEAYYGAQTMRAIENFPISSLRMPRPIIHALGQIKG